jgi:alanine dehydrogenase
MTAIGVPTEVKTDEHRVALTPAGARELSERGHAVLIQAGAGEGADIADQEYVRQGASIVADAAAVFAQGQLIVKVKEPQPQEIAMLTPSHTLFTYLHLAADELLTRGLMASGATCIAYETVEDSAGRLPLLAPMSEIAGKVAAQAAAFMLEKPQGGRGMLLGGAPGVAPGKVMVIGAGVVGYQAAAIAAGLGADVDIYDRSIDRLRALEPTLPGGCSTRFASKLEIEQGLRDADVVIGAVLVRGAKAPSVVAREQLKLMRPGALLVDVSIDQGGCFETSKPTTHSDPVYDVEGVRHYCVANMPSAAPITATHSLTNATLPYVVKLADLGAAQALGEDAGLLAGLNVWAGQITCAPVAEAFDLELVAPGRALNAPERALNAPAGALA